MTLYSLLLGVVALLVLAALVLVGLAFVQYSPAELAQTAGRWLRANAFGLGLYAVVLLVLAIFVL
jgi:hypothetical protein